MYLLPSTYRVRVGVNYQGHFIIFVRQFRTICDVQACLVVGISPALSLDISQMYSEVFWAVIHSLGTFCHRITQDGQDLQPVCVRHNSNNDTEQIVEGTHMTNIDTIVLTITTFYRRRTFVSTNISHCLYSHAMFYWKKLRASL
jgi:hypothetical protein